MKLGGSRREPRGKGGGAGGTGRTGLCQVWGAGRGGAPLHPGPPSPGKVSSPQASDSENYFLRVYFGKVLISRRRKKLYSK